MSVKGTFMIAFSGPSESREALLDALAAAYIAARPIPPECVGAEEETKGWVRLEFHEGTDSPDPEFQRQCTDRAAAVAGPFGYEQRSTGVVVAGAAQTKHIIDTRTGQVVMRHMGELPPEAPMIISEELGIPEEFIEITDPPGLWTIPDRES